MDAATINAKIYAGRGKAALRIGYDYDVYQPFVAANPFSTPITTIKAAFNAADNRYRVPNLYGKPIWFADLDGTQVQPGYYLVNADNPKDVYFIAGMQSLLPIIAIDCPRTVRIAGAPVSTSVGAQAYSGICDTSGEYVDVLGTGSPFVGWPASITLGKGSASVPDALPTGTRKAAGWQILLPPSVPVAINAGMRVIDDLGRKYEIFAAELSDLGWRIMATEDHA